MMKFAVNYSNPLIRLIKENAIEIDLIKCPDWDGMLKEAQPYGPITIHFDLKAGLGQTFDLDFDRIRYFMERTGTPHINTHLITPRNFNPEDPAELEKINRLWREELQVLIDQFGPEHVLLEHFPYTTAMPHIRPAADAKVFSQVILDTGCQLLLDLAHARITADTLGMDAKDYIQALPLDRLAEMHITGVKQHGGVLTDHFEMGAGDWEIFEWALDEIKDGHWQEPNIVSFEYGGVGDVFVWRTNYDFLKAQVPQMMTMVHSE